MALEVAGPARPSLLRTTLVAAVLHALRTRGPNRRTLDAEVGYAEPSLTATDGNLWLPAGY